MLGNVVAAKRGKTTPAKGRRKKSIDEPTGNHKITDYFPVRRSSRKTTDQIKKETSLATEDAIITGSGEKDLKIIQIPTKGRGVVAARIFAKNEYVVEYKGELIDRVAAKKREEEYSQDSSVGCYMYYFDYKGKHYCVDATKESPYLGRLVNHSARKPNLKTKVIEIKSIPHLVLIAKRLIEVDEELLYDYGDRTRDAVENNPWLTES
uniref:[histone H4]-lysine(20) N-methyltransferase n=1 Tax=Plectus sambesii TaxID=2011161 RepID=A0A914W6J2_9BILA